MVLDICGGNVFMSWNLDIIITIKKYNIVREIYTFVMWLCTGHCILSRKSKGYEESDICEIIMSHFSVIALP